MHIDCDIYSSTKTVLEAASSSIVTGTVLLFDEYLNYEGWQANEHRAFMEFVNKSGMQFEFIALTYSGAVAVQVTRPGKSVLEANSDNLT